MGNKISNSNIVLYKKETLIDHDKHVSIYALSAESGNIESSIHVIPDPEGGVVGLKLWPGSLQLAKFLVNVRPDLVRGNEVIELGCGVGLAGLAVAKFCHPTSVVLTDRDSVRPVVGAAIRDNGLTQTTRFEALEKFNQKTNTRIVIGSELVYAEEQTPLAHVLDSLVTDLLVLCYTERSAEDSDYFNNRILGNEKFTLMQALRIGSRRSDLARLQAQLVGARIGSSNFVYKEAPGDMNLKDPLWKMPEMGVFTSFLRKYLQSGEIDLVVHSWKDLPIEKDADTVIVGTMPRADTRDLLLVNTEALNEAYTTGHLVILSSSPRRKHNLPEFLKKSIPISPEGKEIRTVEFRDVRGNIQTRLLKLCEATGTDRPTGLIVAKAAIDRFLLAGSQFDEFKAAGELVRKCLDACLWQVLPLSVNPTAAAQGALAVEMLDSEKNADVRKKVADQINCDKTFGSVNEEREILKSLGGGCHQAIGCTILRRAFGKVTFLRGRTDEHQEDMMVSKIDSLNEGKKTDSKIRAAGVEEFVSVGGKGGIQLFNREDVVGATAKIEKVLKKSKPAVGLYVAKSDALPENVKPESLKGRSVWTAGVQTWFSLAKRGVWVNGTSDSLGEGEPIDTYLLRNQSQDSGWIKLTHTEGSFDVSKGPNEFIDIIPTYRLKVKQGLDVDELIKGKRFFYFSSGSAYKAFVGLKSEIREKFLKGEWVAGCGPGNSLDTIKREIANVSVAYNFSDFVRQHS